MATTWKAATNVYELMEDILQSNHTPRLAEAAIAVAFSDSKAFIKNRFNWGSVKKFTEFNKIWQDAKYDFCIVLCGDIWHTILDENQRKALLDLHLTCCDVEYEPEIIVEGKKKVVKDDWGRVKYTDIMKYDDNGNPKWYVSPLDLAAFTKNGKRYGLWHTEFVE